jgi:hypothetical protein
VVLFSVCVYSDKDAYQSRDDLLETFLENPGLIAGIEDR